MYLKLFCGSSNPQLSEKVSRFLNVPLGDLMLGRFPDGEITVKANTDVRGSDVFLIQPTCPPVNENLMELFLMLDCFRRASAQRITVVMPYFGYARQDRKTEGRVPISAKLVANLITKAGANRVVTIDLHAGQIQGFFDIPLDHLYARNIFIEYIESLRLDNIVVVSPDTGGIQMARAYSNRLGATFATVDKTRISPTEVKSGYVIGEVEGKNVILVDDIIATGGSIVAASHILKEHGAEKIYVCATHGIFCKDGVEKLSQAPIEQIIVTDTIPQRQDLPDKFKVLTVARMLGEAILRIHTNQSVSALFRI
ncbi:MAG: ribose-phosphate pyrophosphokinase [Planctomycetota bacterium]|nr:MAG: ribose-phosphate pyrophosphokinase [Planctomycetota bacterium]